MAKVVIEFDTNAKSATATIDGVVVDNVVAAEMHLKGCYYGDTPDDEDEQEFCFSLTQAERDKANKLSKMTRIVAAEHPEASLSDAREVEGLPGVRRVPAAGPRETAAVRQIVNYFSNR